MTTIQRITYTGSRRPVRGATSTKNAAIELTSIHPSTNDERFTQYQQKLNAGWVVGKARTVRRAA
jgi:hypothetical protein